MDRQLFRLHLNINMNKHIKIEFIANYNINFRDQKLHRDNMFMFKDFNQPLA